MKLTSEFASGTLTLFFHGELDHHAAKQATAVRAKASLDERLRNSSFILFVSAIFITSLVP